MSNSWMQLVNLPDSSTNSRFYTFSHFLLIVGCGRYNHPLNPQVRQFVKSIGMKLETVDSKCCINLQHTE
ncbi:putative MTH938-like superfamily protein [Arabidopsis thaliana]